MMPTVRLFRCLVFLLLVHSAPMGTAVAATQGIWMSPAEIRALPMSGSGWDNIRSTAYGSWGTPDLADQNLSHSAACIAGAMVYVRTGDATLRTKVRDAIMAAKRTHDVPTEYGRALSLGRQLGGYAIAADLIDLETFDPVSDAELRPWMTLMLNVNLPLSNPLCPTLVYCHENVATNWATFCGASRIATSLYLRDAADVARSAKIFEAWLGNRAAYPSDAPGPNGYFEETGNFDPSWVCNVATWTAVNPPCVKSGVDVNGAIVEDIARGGGLAVPPGSTGMMYSWEVLQGVFVQAEMLNRIGYDTYNWSNQALRRAMDFMVRMGWGMDFPSNRYVPWIANKRYGTNYPTYSPIPMGRLMGFADWTHASTGPQPADVTRPASITDLGGPTSGTSSLRTSTSAKP